MHRNEHRCRRSAANASDENSLSVHVDEFAEGADGGDDPILDVHQLAKLIDGRIEPGCVTGLQNAVLNSQPDVVLRAHVSDVAEGLVGVTLGTGQPQDQRIRISRLVVFGDETGSKIVNLTVQGLRLAKQFFRFGNPREFQRVLGESRLQSIDV